MAADRAFQGRAQLRTVHQGTPPALIPPRVSSRDSQLGSRRGDRRSNVLPSQTRRSLQGDESTRRAARRKAVPSSCQRTVGLIAFAIALSNFRKSAFRSISRNRSSSARVSSLTGCLTGFSPGGGFFLGTSIPLRCYGQRVTHCTSQSPWRTSLGLCGD